MRNCAIWITPWVDRNTEVILDTSAMTDAEWRAVVHADPDTPPKDTLLVLIHPARCMDLIAAVVAQPFTFMDFQNADFQNAEGRRVAGCLIDKHCYNDPELRRRLRW